jgi:hypothetical protein
MQPKWGCIPLPHATVPNEPISRSSGRLTRVTSRAHSQTRLECAVLHVGMLSALRA